MYDLPPLRKGVMRTEAPLSCGQLLYAHLYLNGHYDTGIEKKRWGKTVVSYGFMLMPQSTSEILANSMNRLLVTKNIYFSWLRPKPEKIKNVMLEKRATISEYC